MYQLGIGHKEARLLMVSLIDVNLASFYRPTQASYLVVYLVLNLPEVNYVLFTAHETL